MRFPVVGISYNAAVIRTRDKTYYDEYTDKVARIIEVAQGET